MAALLDQLLDPISEALDGPAARRLLALRANGAAQQRIDDLARRRDQGTLTDAEREEYTELVGASAVIGALQAKARARLGAGAEQEALGRAGLKLAALTLPREDFGDWEMAS